MSTSSPPRPAIFAAYVFPLLLLAVLRLTLAANICDDAYISFKTAVSLGEGRGMVFNPGERIYVVTTPLWAALLGAVRALGVDVVLGARVLGFLFELAALAGMVHLGRRLCDSAWVGALGAVFLCTNPVFLLTSFSGMETALTLSVILGSLILLTYRRYRLALLVAAAGVFVRFDALILFGVVLGYSLWSLRAEVRSAPRSALLTVLPAAALLALYAAFGLLVYGDAVPMSVQAKSLGRPGLFSGDWFRGALETARQFGLAFTGKEGFWYTHPTPFPVLLVPVIPGLLHAVRNSRFAAPLLFSLLYAASFVLTGESYVRNFPWYFVPFLPGAYLVAAAGVGRLCDAASRRVRVARPWILFPVVLLVWVAVAYAPLRNGADLLTRKGMERERAYASVSVFLGRHLDGGAVVAANEIGALGFFSPEGVSILDLFGILRTREDLHREYLELVKERSPEAVVTKGHFAYRETIDRALPGTYVWLTYRHLRIGLRSDVAARFGGTPEELAGIYGTLRIDREPPR